MKKYVVLVILLVTAGFSWAMFFHLSSHIHADAKFWGTLDTNSKFVYVSAYREGEARGIAIARIYSKKTRKQLETEANIVRAHNILYGMDVGKVVSGVDKFYSEGAHINQPISVAFDAVAKRIQNIPFAPSVYADGKMWNTLDTKRKFVYVSGYREGEEKGMAIKDVYSKKTYEESKEEKSIVKGHGVLCGAGTNEIVSGIDKFYSKGANSSQHINIAFYIVVSRMQGVPERKLQKYIDAYTIHTETINFKTEVKFKKLMI